MSETSRGLATGDSQEMESNGLLADIQAYIMAIVLSEEP